MRLSDTMFVVAMSLIVAIFSYSWGFKNATRRDDGVPVCRMPDVRDPALIDAVVWQEMPKLAWQKSDGSPCDGYVGECSLLEAGSVSVTVKDSRITDAGVYDVDYDWSSMCACRVVREP